MCDSKSDWIEQCLDVCGKRRSSTFSPSSSCLLVPAIASCLLINKCHFLFFLPLSSSVSDFLFVYWGPCKGGIGGTGGEGKKERGREGKGREQKGGNRNQTRCRSAPISGRSRGLLSRGSCCYCRWSFWRNQSKPCRHSKN